MIAGKFSSVGEFALDMYIGIRTLFIQDNRTIAEKLNQTGSKWCGALKKFLFNIPKRVIKLFTFLGTKLRNIFTCRKKPKDKSEEKKYIYHKSILTLKYKSSSWPLARGK